MADPPSFKKLLASLPEEAADQVRDFFARGWKLRAKRARLRRFRGRMHLDSIRTGLWKGKDIRGEEIHIEMNADSVAFEESRVQLHVAVELDIQVPALRTPKVYKLGPVRESVATPQLPRISLSSLVGDLSANFLLSSVRARKVTAEVAPIANVDAGDIHASDLDLEDLSAPTQGFAIPGLQAGPMSAKHLRVDGAKASRGHASGAGAASAASASDVTLSGATIVDGSATAAEGQDLNVGFEVQLPTLQIKTFPAMPSAIERLVTRLSVRIEPKVAFRIGKLKLDGLLLNTHVGSLRVGEVTIPVDVRGIAIDDVELDGLGFDEVELAEHPDDAK